MAPAPFPDPGQDDGDQPPLPGDQGRDETGHGGDGGPDGMPAGTDPDRDWDADADLARFLADVDAGREPVPEEDVQVPVVTFSLGETADVDPAVLAAMIGPDGLGGDTFAADKAADAMRPCPLLSALAEQARSWRWSW